MTSLLTFAQATSVENTAYEILVSDLERVGNVLSDTHRQALRAILSEMTGFATGRLTGRRCFSLGTGCGKTSAIVAWITALYQHNYRKIAVSVSASKIEALCDLKRQLMLKGIPEKRIGLKHSDPKASLPSTEDDDRLYQLVTHARVRGGSSQPLFLEHKGRPRTLMIYDESLIRSDVEVISERRLRKQIAALKEHVKDQTDESSFRPLFDFTDQVVDQISQALKQAKAKPESSPILNIDFPEKIIVDGFKSLLGRSDEWESIRRLLDSFGSPLRLMLTAQSEGIVRYQISVPPELKNVLILDASYPIRELIQLDKTITDSTPSFVRNVKRFDHSVIHHMKHASGREATTQNFSQKTLGERTISREVINIIKKTPNDRSILIFTFKHHPGDVNIPDTLLRDISSEEIDIHQKTPSGNPRINVLTWGDETSLNQFSHCSVVIFAGILHLPQLQVASQVVAQQDNLLAQTTQKQIDRVCESEMAHRVYQALSRGSCRIVENGQAKPMDVYLMHSRDHLKDNLELVMPGLQWKAWIPSAIAINTNHSQVDVLAMKMYGLLESLPPTVMTVKTKDLRIALNIETAIDNLRKLFNRAIVKVCQSRAWAREGHSLRRI